MCLRRSPKVVCTSRGPYRDPDTTRPSSAEILTQLIVFSCPEKFRWISFNFSPIRGFRADGKAPRDPNDDTQNYSFCKLQLMIETFGH